MKVWAILILLCSCASAPEKKVLQDKDYQAWQRDLSVRMGREPEDLSLVKEMLEVSLINEDFPTALASVRTLQEKSYGDQRQLALDEIQILRYSWRLAESLEKIDAYIKKNPKDPARATLAKRRPVIEKSMALPPPLKVSPYAKNPFADKGFTLVQLMQAPEIGYFEGPGQDIFAYIKKHARIDEEVWTRRLKDSPQIGAAEDAEILHLPLDAAGISPDEIPPFVQSSADGSVFVHADLTRETLGFLKKQNCSLPAFSPWLDFFITSCKRGDNFDLVLYTRNGNQWKEAENKSLPQSVFDEVAPRISADGRFLFFASDGLPGYGAFDYYYSTIEYSGECADGVCRQTPRFGNAVNFGPQVNTYHNEVIALQVSPLAQGVIFSAEGKNGLVGKTADTNAIPKIQETLSYRFIAYSGHNASPRPVTVTPLKGDSRKAWSTFTGAKADWLRLIAGAEYQVSFSTTAGVPLKFRFKAQAKEANYAIERFTVESSPEAVTVTYDEDSTKVTETIRPEIEKAAAQLKENPDLHALIEGHTDNIGPEKYNQDLSEKRAEAAKKQLISLGIAPQRITARGWGMLRQLNANSNKEETRANRRIEILLVR